MSASGRAVTAGKRPKVVATAIARNCGVCLGHCSHHGTIHRLILSISKPKKKATKQTGRSEEEAVAIRRTFGGHDGAATCRSLLRDRGSPVTAMVMRYPTRAAELDRR